MKLLNVFLFLLLVFCLVTPVSAEIVADKTINDFRVIWDDQGGFTEHTYIISVQNLQSDSRTIPIGLFVNETSFDTQLISGMIFEEWKPVPYTYTVNHYDDVNYTVWDETNQTWNNWTKSVLNYTETIVSEKLDWKRSKSLLFNSKDEVVYEDYGDILIPKYGSKEKDGTINGTKIFRLTIPTPIVTLADGTFGSSGRVALFVDGFEYCPYWNTSFTSRKSITITTNGSSTPANYQVLLNITYESEMQTDFDDIRFTNSSDGELSYWIESKVNGSYANVWVKLSDAITHPGNDTVWVYYGNDNVSSASDGRNTFIVWDDFVGGTEQWTIESAGGGISADRTVNHRLDFSYKAGIPERAYIDLDSDVGNYIFEYTIHMTSQGRSNMALTGFTDIIPPIWSDVYTNSAHLNGFYTQRFDQQNFWYNRMYETGVRVGGGETQTTFLGTTYYGRLTRSDTFMSGEYYTDAERTVLLYGNSSPGSVTTLRYLGLIFGNHQDGSYTTYRNMTGWITDVKMRKYISNDTTISYGTTQYYVESLHYNVTSPYNNTIELDGTITVNRTSIPSDDTNWTANSTGTTYWTFTTAVTPAGYTNFTISGDVLDNFTARNLSVNRVYELKNTSGTIESQTTNNNGYATFEVNLVAGTYWIEIRVLSSFTSTTPATPYHSLPNTSVTFTGTVDQTGNFTWYLNGSIVQYNNSTSTAAYTNNSSVVGGPYNITLVFTNVNNTVQYTWAWHVTEGIRVPMSLFMLMGFMVLISLFASMITTGVPAICMSILGGMIAFINSQIAVNGQLVENIGGVASDGTVLQGTMTYELPALSYLFIFVGLIMIGLTIYHISQEIQYRKDNNYTEVDF